MNVKKKVHHTLGKSDSVILGSTMQTDECALLDDAQKGEVTEISP
jgi:hypothetical protein